MSWQEINAIDVSIERKFEVFFFSVLFIEKLTLLRFWDHNKISGGGSTQARSLCCAKTIFMFSLLLLSQQARIVKGCKVAFGIILFFSSVVFMYIIITAVQNEPRGHQLTSYTIVSVYIQFIFLSSSLNKELSMKIVKRETCFERWIN